MTMDEFNDILNESHVDDEYLDIPSDPDSNIDSDSDVENFEVGTREPELFEDSEAESESDIPLSELAKTLAKTTNSNYVGPMWCRDNGRIPEYSAFKEECGVANFIKELDNPSPGDVFRLFFTNELIDYIVYQTNLYAEQAHLANGKQYIPVSKNEIEIFVGLNLLMGIKRLPSYRDYWSSAPDMHDAHISSKMTVNRFGWLLSNLHLNDNLQILNRNDPKYDKLYKLRPFLNIIQKQFELCYNPTEFIAIDESMVKFKGRSSLKQYLPKKPVKRGYKIWVLADQKGYMWRFQIYTGKDKNSPEKALGARVVKDLTRNLENKYHRLYFDNFFNSVPLMEWLLERKILACGTVNVSRKYLPVFQADRKMQRGDFDSFVSNTNLAVVKWKDNRAVHLLSNHHDPKIVTTVKRKTRDGEQIDVKVPQMVLDYNIHMNSVDRFDQKKKVYEIDRRAKKWWHRLFFYFLDACVVNSYIIYSELEVPKLGMKDFRRAVVSELLSVSISKKRKLSEVQIKNHKPFVPNTLRLKESTHMPERSTRRRCAHCSNAKQQVRTEWFCDTCKVPLCLSAIKNCFKDFHQK